MVKLYYASIINLLYLSGIPKFLALLYYSEDLYSENRQSSKKQPINVRIHLLEYFVHSFLFKNE